MKPLTWIILTAALGVSASSVAAGTDDASEAPVADAGGGAEADGVQDRGAYLHALRFVDESGQVIATHPAFDQETTSYTARLDENSNALALEMSSGHGIRVGLAFQVASGGMTMSRYVDLRKAARDRGSAVSYRHAFSPMATRGIFEVIVRVATEDGQDSNTYVIAIVHNEPALACSVGQELRAGQRCRLSDSGVFEIHSDGCVVGLPDVSGEVIYGEGSMSEGGLCIRRYVQKGGFRARASVDSSTWRIESLP